MISSARLPSTRTLATTIFLIWSAVGAVVMAAGINEVWVRGTELPAGIQAIGAAILRVSDALWISLAAGLVLASEIGRLGPARAWRAFGLIAVGSGAAEWLGATTGWLFGHYDYTGQFGWRLGGVLPFTIPLAWYAVVTGACLVCDRWPAMPVAARVAGVATLATLTDINLEPVAIHLRGYWQWTDGPGGAVLAQPPLFNYATWFGLAALLSLCVPRAPAGSPHTRGIFHGIGPVGVLVAMNVLFLFAHLGNRLFS